MKYKTKIDIIYEDSDIVVANKPAGVFTIPDRYIKTALNLYDYFKKKHNDIYTVHRLDKDTSGVIVFAKHAEAHKFLNNQFQEHTVDKTYHVVLSGNMHKNEIDIDIPIAINPGKRGLSMPSVRGKSSLTKLKVIEKYRNATFVECNLITGRHHQIRVHCSAIGFPLLIDELYGNNSEFFVSSVKRKYNLKKGAVEKPIISRLSMHAIELSFIHPTTKDKVKFKADYPRDFSALLQVLRKYSAVSDILQITDL